jgi:hypothetical protein
MLDIAGTYQIKSNSVRGEPLGSPGSGARAGWSYGGGTGRAGLDRARLAGRVPAQVAAVLTGTAAVIGSRARWRGRCGWRRPVHRPVRLHARHRVGELLFLLQPAIQDTAAPCSEWRPCWRCGGAGCRRGILRGRPESPPRAACLVLPESSRPAGRFPGSCRRCAPSGSAPGGASRRSGAASQERRGCPCRRTSTVRSSPSVMRPLRPAPDMTMTSGNAGHQGGGGEGI